MTNTRRSNGEHPDDETSRSATPEPQQQEGDPFVGLGEGPGPDFPALEEAWLRLEIAQRLAAIRRAQPAPPAPGTPLPEAHDGGSWDSVVRRRSPTTDPEAPLVESPLPGHLCETCLDAPAARLVPAPWGGDMGICLECLIRERRIRSASTRRPRAEGS